MEKINLGGKDLSMWVSGVNETLEKLNLLEEKIAEVNTLINELNSAKIEINFSGCDLIQQVDA